MTTTRRGPIALAAAGLLLAGCSSTVEGTASPSPTTSPPSSSSSSSSSSGSAPTSSGDVDDLSAGLLPDDAFGAGADVTPVAVDDIAAAAVLGGGLEGVTVTPESCAQAIAQSQPSVEGLTGFAGQTATTDTAVVAELITEGVPGDPVADVAAAAAACPQATLTSPDIGTATITLAPLTVPALGDGSAGLVYTTSIQAPDGSQLSVPALYAFVADGDRLLTVLSTSFGGTVDQAAFTALVQQAFDRQAEQLD